MQIKLGVWCNVSLDVTANVIWQVLDLIFAPVIDYPDSEFYSVLP